MIGRPTLYAFLQCFVHLGSLVGGVLVGRSRLLSPGSRPGRRGLRHVERHLGVVGVREHLLVDPGMVTG